MAAEKGGMVGDESVKRVTYVRVTVILLTLLFFAVSFYIRAFDAAGSGFNVAGFRLLAYHAARLGFAAYLAIACYSLGYWIVAGLRLRTGLQGRKAFILYFFLGASAYGIALGIFGLLQILVLPTALLVVLPALLFMRRPLEVLLARQGDLLDHRSATTINNSSPFVSVFTLGVAGLAGVSVLMFIATRVVFIPNPDGNIWEHYLHYYRSVLDSGSTLPGVVWHHFYNSKGGGLVFLADLLSDVFSVQLVSACMMFVAGVIIFDILSDYCRERVWPFFGLIVYFTYLFGGVLDGGMFRVHALILGYAAFLFWGWQRLSSVEADARRETLIAVGASLAYIGYYQPVAVMIFAPAFVMMTAARWILGARTEFKWAVIFGIIVGCATAATILINWLLTGLLEVTPIKLLWAIADKAKVGHVFGTGGINFFIAVNNDLDAGGSWLQHVYSTIHAPRLFKSLTLLACFVLVWRALMRIAAREPLEKGELLLAEIIVFIAPLVLLTIFFPSPSVERMGLYSIVFVVLASVVVWDRFIDLALSDLVINTVVLARQSVHEAIVLPLKQVALVVVMLAGGMAMIVTEFRNLEYNATIFRFAGAGLSVKTAMERMEESIPWLVSGTTVKAISDFRASSGYDGALLSLVYDASYAYFLPGRGVISEPTYAVVRDPKSLLSADAGAVAKYLRERNIEYVTLNLSSRLFTTVAFTSLFETQNVQQYFDIAYEKGDFFVLRLREKVAESTISKQGYLLTVLELKRSGVLRTPFTERFQDKLIEGNETIRSLDDFENLKNRFRQSVQEMMRAEMLDRVSLPTSMKFISNLMAAVDAAISEAEPESLFKRTPPRYGEGNINLSKIAVSNLLLAIVRSEIRRDYLAEFGPTFAGLAERCDERFPFEIERPSDAVCR